MIATANRPVFNDIRVVSFLAADDSNDPDDVETIAHADLAFSASAIRLQRIVVS
jgi:hypothetical protein